MECFGNKGSSNGGLSGIRNKEERELKKENGERVKQKRGMEKKEPERVFGAKGIN